MTIKLTATEAKARLLALLDDVASGEEVEITRHGRPVARLSPAAGGKSMRGSLSGLALATTTDEDLFSTGAEWELK